MKPCIARSLFTAFGLIAMSIPTTFAQGPTVVAGPVSPAAAQSQQVSFDVISIKPSKDLTRVDWWNYSDDGMALVNVTAKSLVANAYGVKSDLISGVPGWAESVGFDINAKVVVTGNSPRLSRKQIRLMTQSLLSDRFKLVVHPETKEVPIYELTIAKGGPKLKEAKPNDPSGSGTIAISDGNFVGQGITLARFANVLSDALHRTVVDKTGLTRTYDITMPMSMTGLINGGPPPVDEAGPSLFNTIQEQLVLKLNSAKGPGNGLVIDHIEKPSEN